jgi:hypothetical protein
MGNPFSTITTSTMCPRSLTEYLLSIAFSFLNYESRLVLDDPRGLKRSAGQICRDQMSASTRSTNQMQCVEGFYAVLPVLSLLASLWFKSARTLRASSTGRNGFSR